MDGDAIARADADARAALALLLAGRVAEGLDAYRAATPLEVINRIPVGLHLLALEQAGHSQTAEALRELAVRRGANVAVRHVVLKLPAEKALTEYEELFARGIANARMVLEYLKLLAALGRAGEIGHWLAPEQLFRRVRLDPDQAEAVERVLLGREEASPFQESEQSVRKMRMVEDLHDDPDPIIRGLFERLAAETRAYLADWQESAHPLAGLIPERVELRGWGLISRGEGSNARHIHPKGWATGVYYPTSADGGALCVGGPADSGGSANGWFETEVLPEAGLLVLMPSYYSHWTRPLGREGLRTSIAFDLRSAGDERTIDGGAAVL